ATGNRLSEQLGELRARLEQIEQSSAAAPAAEQNHAEGVYSIDTLADEQATGAAASSALVAASEGVANPLPASGQRGGGMAWHKVAAAAALLIVSTVAIMLCLFNYPRLDMKQASEPHSESLQRTPEINQYLPRMERAAARLAKDASDRQAHLEMADALSGLY